MSTIVRRRGKGQYGIPDGEHELKALLAEANGIFIKRGFCASDEDVLRLIDNTVGEEFLNAVRDDMIANGGARGRARFEHERTTVPMFVVEYFIREIERRLSVIKAKKGKDKSRM